MVLLGISNESYFQTVVFCLECLTAFMSFIICSHLFYQLYGKNVLICIGIMKAISEDVENARLTVTTTKLFSMISVLFYTITPITLSIHHWTRSYSIYYSSILISDISWTIGQLSCYLLWITRLYWTFDGSVHQSRKIFFYSLGVLAIIFAFSMGSAQILFFLERINYKYFHSFIYYIIISIIVCIIDLILSTIVMYSFLSKLHDLTAHCKQHWIGDNNEYQRDIHKVKMVKAESTHFKYEKRQFKQKIKKKQRSKAKKKGIVIVCKYVKNVSLYHIHNDNIIQHSTFSPLIKS